MWPQRLSPGRATFYDPFLSEVRCSVTSLRSGQAHQSSNLMNVVSALINAQGLSTFATCRDPDTWPRAFEAGISKFEVLQWEHDK